MSNGTSETNSSEIEETPSETEEAQPEINEPLPETEQNPSETEETSLGIEETPSETEEAQPEINEPLPETEQNPSETEETSLGIEERLADLELAVGELKYSIKNLDASSISDLRQRVEDLEDLIIVEQAGISELKEMIEESIAPESLGEKVDETFEGRLRNVEFSIDNLVGKSSDLESKLESIENRLSGISTDQPLPEMDNFYNKFIQLQDELSELRLKLDSVSKEIAEKVKESSTKSDKSEYDLGVLFSRVSDVMHRVSFLEKKTKELGLNKPDIIEINKKIDSLDAASKKLTEDMGNLKNFNIIEINKKIDSLDAASKKLTEDMGNFRDSLKDIESSQQWQEVQDKISQLEDKISKISKNSTVSRGLLEERIKEISKRLDPLEARMTEIETTTTEKFSNLSQEIEKNRKELETRESSLEKDIKSSVKKDTTESLNKRLKEIGIEGMAKDLKRVVERIDEIENKVDSVEEKYKKMEIETTFGSPISDAAVQVELLKSMCDELEDIIERIEHLESRMEILETIESRINILEETPKTYTQSSTGHVQSPFVIE